MFVEKLDKKAYLKKIKFWDLIKKIEGPNWKFSKNRETHGIIEPNKYKKGDILRKNAKVFKIVPKRKVIQCGLFVKIFFGQMTNFVPIFYTRCQFSPCTMEMISLVYDYVNVLTN